MVPMFLSHPSILQQANAASIHPSIHQQRRASFHILLRRHQPIRKFVNLPQPEPSDEASERLSNMVQIQRLLAPAALPSATISVVSYNVLLPNSVDGWWNFKMYMPPLTQQPHQLPSGEFDENGSIFQSTWEYRKDLLRQRISTLNADVVCFQECSPRSFEDDFDFMKELGYSDHELFKKGRFRPATFWKSDKLELASPAVHKDRTLLTALRVRSETAQQSSSAQDASAWYILNCHLQAGKQAPRRVRQINEGIKAVMTLARKLKQPSPETDVKLIVCGDFNGGPECGAVRFLEDGYIDDTFREDGEPVSSNRKNLPLASPMTDVVSIANVMVDDDSSGYDAAQGRSPPPTMVVSELISNLIEKGTEDDPKLCRSMLDRLGRIYARLATSESGQMSLADVEGWLTKINFELGRGDEYREAAKQMGYVDDGDPDASRDEKKKRVRLPESGELSLQGFIEVYHKEVRAGKFWGVGHDMAVLGDPLPDDGVFTARYDRMYCSAAVQTTAVIDTPCEKSCPNAEEPSDHLPVSASFVAST